MIFTLEEVEDWLNIPFLYIYTRLLMLACELFFLEVKGVIEDGVSFNDLLLFDLCSLQSFLFILSLPLQDFILELNELNPPFLLGTIYGRSVNESFNLLLLIIVNGLGEVHPRSVGILIFA